MRLSSPLRHSDIFEVWDSGNLWGSVWPRSRSWHTPLPGASDLQTWAEQRMAKRYRMRSRAQIVVLGHEAIGCSVAEISATGARVLVDPAAAVPDSFILKLKGRARRCSVVLQVVLLLLD